jgi:hypothetical protein
VPLPLRLEDRLSLLDVEEVLLGCAVRLGCRGGSGIDGIETRDSPDELDELDEPPPEEELEPDEPELPEEPEEPELVVGGSLRPTALWAHAQDGTARLTATAKPSANRVDLAITESSKQALLQLYCHAAQAAIPCIPQGCPGQCPPSLPSPADGTTMENSVGSKVRGF